MLHILFHTKRVFELVFEHCGHTVKLLWSKRAGSTAYWTNSLILFVELLIVTDPTSARVIIFFSHAVYTGELDAFFYDCAQFYLEVLPGDFLLWRRLREEQTSICHLIYGHIHLIIHDWNLRLSGSCCLFTA